MTTLMQRAMTMLNLKGKKKNGGNSAIHVPHMEQYNGPFAMEETAFNAAIDYVNRIDLSAHILATQARIEEAKKNKTASPSDDDDDDDEGGGGMEMTDDGIAVIDLCGTMTKYGSSLSDGCSTIALRKTIRTAANDPACRGILLRVDSPGGSADGTQELGDEIAGAGIKKPLFAFVDGMAASAGYWAASQAQKIVAGPASMVGSIGTYGVMYDRSAQFAQNGVKAIVVRAGEQKGAGTPGTEVTPEQIADRARVINEINDLFIGSVAKGRKMDLEKARALNDGRVHVGEKAKAQGLVDAVGSFEEAMSALRGAVAAKGNSQKNSPAPARMAGAQPKEIAMSESPTVTAPVTVQAASLKELKTKFPKSSADWREKCLEDNLTLSAASDRWAETLAAENAQLQEDLKLAKASGKPIGGSPIPNGGPSDAPRSDAGDPKADLMAIVDKKIASGTPRAKAFAQACKENPELHQSYIAAHTEEHGDKVRKGHRGG